MFQIKSNFIVSYYSDAEFFKELKSKKQKFGLIEGEQLICFSCCSCPGSAPVL